MRPVIGISCSAKCMEKSANFTFLPQEFHYLGTAYTTAVERAGGIPVILPSFDDPKLMREVAGRLDGLILSGGPDLDPALFGERIVSGVGPVDVKRDAAEMELAEYVLGETEMPVLGICRGMQLINVAEGGDLIQDLKSVGKAEHRLSMFPRYYPSHEVTLEADSRVAQIMGTETPKTNSFHHQAVRCTAPEWITVGTAADDGVIEAIEKPGERFLVAVQWHTEAMAQSEEEQALFKALVDAARIYSGE